MRVLRSRGGDRWCGSGVFFLSKHTCINHKNTVQRSTHVQVHSGRKQRIALPPDYLHKGPWKIEKNNWNPRTFARRIAPPSAGDGHPEQEPRTPDQLELHRFKAFRRAAVEARPRGRTKGSTVDPSAGDALRAPAILEADLVGVSQKEIERGNL